MALKWAVNIWRSSDPEAPDAEALGLLTEGYLREGVESWTLVDAEGKSIPVNKPNITAHLLSNPTAANLVGEEADGLYSEVMLPLVMSASASSQPTPTDEPTSPKTGSTSEESPSTPEAPTSPTLLKPFSISTIQTDATVTTNGSLVGVSS